MGTYVLAQARAPPAGHALLADDGLDGPEAPAAYVPVPPSTGNTSVPSTSDSGSCGLAPSAVDLAPRAGGPGALPGGGPAPLPPLWAQDDPARLFRALLDRTRTHHRQLRAQMAEFEEWLDDMVTLFADDMDA